MAYEQLKRYQVKRTSKLDGTLSSVDYLWLSGASKVFAGSATYPYQVVRARLQMYEAGQTYNGARDAIAQIWKQEGVRGFYKGLAPNLVRVLPSTWVTFLVYEKTKTVLPGLFMRHVSETQKYRFAIVMKFKVGAKLFRAGKLPLMALVSPIVLGTKYGDFVASCVGSSSPPPRTKLSNLS
ncbi:MAG: hypothetical protein Q9208_007151 [Pyrenodesmia sp. 3 TL-2023]